MEVYINHSSSLCNARVIQELVPISTARQSNSKTAKPEKNDKECDLIDKMLFFEDWLEKSNLKNSTKRVYLARVRQFLNFLADNFETCVESKPSFNEVTTCFLEYGKFKFDYKATTVNNFISIFRLYSRNMNETYDDSKFESTNVQKKHLSLSERNCLLRISHEESTRNNALVLLFLTTNITLAQCTNLRISNLIFTDQETQIQIIQADKCRIEIANVELSIALRKWMEQRESFYSFKSEFLFPGKTGKQISRAAIDFTLRKIGWKAGLNICARTLRNTHRQTAKRYRNTTMQIPTIAKAAF